MPFKSGRLGNMKEMQTLGQELTHSNNNAAARKRRGEVKSR